MDADDYQIRDLESKFFALQRRVGALENSADSANVASQDELTSVESRIDNLQKIAEAMVTAMEDQAKQIAAQNERLEALETRLDPIEEATAGTVSTYFHGH